MGSYNSEKYNLGGEEMKKLLTIFLSVCIASCLCVALSACDNSDMQKHAFLINLPLRLGFACQSSETFFSVLFV